MEVTSKKESKVLFGSEAQIMERVRNFFSKRFMVGPKNGVNKTELFTTIYEADPRVLDVYTKEYFEKVLSRAVTKARKEVMVVLKDGKYYVAESEEDTAQYRKRCQNLIEANKSAIDRADSWVDEKKFKRLK